ISSYLPRKACMFKTFLQPRPRIFSGIDLTTPFLKLLTLSQSDAGYCIENYNRIKLPAHAILGQKINNPKEIANAIQAVLVDFKTPVKEIAMAIPDSLVISKIIPMDAAFDEEEIQAQIIMQAKQYFTYSIEEIYFDFMVIGSSQIKNQCIDV